MGYLPYYKDMLVGLLDSLFNWPYYWSAWLPPIYCSVLTVSALQIWVSNLLDCTDLSLCLEYLMILVTVLAGCFDSASSIPLYGFLIRSSLILLSS